MGNKLKSVTHDKEVSEVIKSFVKIGRKISCGPGIIISGKDFFIHVNQWACSYDRNWSDYYLNKGNEELLVKLLTEASEYEMKYAMYGPTTRAIFIDKCINESPSGESK